MSRRPPGLIRRFARHGGGASAIEFALIAPLMILIYFCLLEFCQAFMADRRASHTAAMVADLVAQSEAVTPASLNEVFAIGGMIMRPFPEAPLGMVVSSVTRDSKGVAKVDWSVGKRRTPRGKNSVVDTMPPGLIANGESLIMAEAVYDYDSPFELLPPIAHFRRTYYLRPRTVEKVVCTGC